MATLALANNDERTLQMMRPEIDPPHIAAPS